MSAPLASGRQDGCRAGWVGRVARSGFAAILLLPATVPANAGDVRVSVTSAGIEVVATTAPVSEVLDRLARQTNMKLVYEGPTPRQMVTLAVKRSSVSEVVLAVIEGLGINFALAGGQAGGQTLLLTGSAFAASTSFTAAAPPARPDPRASAEAADLLDPGNGPSDEAEEIPDEMAVPPAMLNRGTAGPAPGGLTGPPVPGSPMQPYPGPGASPTFTPQPMVLPSFQPQPLVFPTPPPPGQPPPGPNPAASRPPLADPNPQP